MSKKEIQDLEIRLENREQIGLKLADQLNEKIHECEKLKKRIAELESQ